MANVFLDSLLQSKELYLASILSQISEVSPLSLRLSASSHFCAKGFDNHKFDIRTIKIMYLLCLDDCEDVRFQGCRLISKFFDENIIMAWYYCINKIWLYVSKFESDQKELYFKMLFYIDFCLDALRAYDNVKY